MTQIIGSAQAAEILGLTRQQVTKFLRSGKLKASRPTGTGKTTAYEINIDDVYDMLHKRTAPITEKMCPQCRQKKPIAAFNRCRGRKDGHASYCRRCRKIQYEEDKERILAQKKQYRSKNHDEICKRDRARYKDKRGEILARRRSQYHKNKDRLNAKHRLRYATDEEYRKRILEARSVYIRENQEGVRRASRLYYHRNKEQSIERGRIWREANSDKSREYNQRYYQANADRLKQEAGQWRKKNQGKRAQYEAKRRAWKSGHNVDTEPISRVAVIERDKATCYICGDGPLSDSEIHLDHVVPLSRGGAHVLDNVRVACATCNCKKHDKTHKEVLQMVSAGL